jgi:hypothetical protein
MKAAVLSLLLFGAIFPSHAGWIVGIDPVGISYSVEPGKGYESFEDALKELAAAGRIEKLKGISAWQMLKSDSFQKELAAELERTAPKEWQAAQKSAGNMHNPKMGKLWAPFKNAVLATPTIRELGDALAHYSLEFTEVSCEKFEYRATPGKPERRFSGSIWIDIEKKK